MLCLARGAQATYWGTHVTPGGSVTTALHQCRRTASGLHRAPFSLDSVIFSPLRSASHGGRASHRGCRSPGRVRAWRSKRSPLSSLARERGGKVDTCSLREPSHDHDCNRGGGQGGREEFGWLGAPEPRAGGERLPFAGAWMLGWMLACWGWRTEAQFAFSSGRLTVVVVVVMCIVYGEGRCCAVLLSARSAAPPGRGTVGYCTVVCS